MDSSINTSDRNTNPPWLSNSKPQCSWWLQETLAFTKHNIKTFLQRYSRWESPWQTWTRRTGDTTGWDMVISISRFYQTVLAPSVCYARFLPSKRIRRTTTCGCFYGGFKSNIKYRQSKYCVLWEFRFETFHLHRHLLLSNDSGRPVSDRSLHFIFASNNCIDFQSCIEQTKPLRNFTFPPSDDVSA